MDVIVLNELSDMISELNSSLGSDIDTINSNVDEVKATVNAINTATAVNNTASTTGTLSQKLSSIISTLSTVSSNVTTLKNKSFCKISGGTATPSYSNADGQWYLNISGYWIACCTDEPYPSHSFQCRYGKTRISNGIGEATYTYIKFSNN